MALGPDSWSFSQGSCRRWVARRYRILPVPGPSGSELTPRVAWAPAVPQAGPWPGCLSLPVERSVLLQVEPIYWNFGPSAANVGVLR